VGEIEGENRVLQAKLDSTNISLTSVVKEMYDLLEEHEPSKLANMDVDSEEDDEDMDEDEMHPLMNGVPMQVHGSHHQVPQSVPITSSAHQPISVGSGNIYEEQRPHAGTGGSSKMRSRPNNATSAIAYTQPPSALNSRPV